MKQVNYDYSKYDHKEELKLMVNAVNDSFDKFAKSVDGRKTSATRIENSINKKSTALDKLNNIKEDLTNKIDELETIKQNTNREIKALGDKRSLIHYDNAEVMKMETDDISSLIEVKKAKVAKLDSKITETIEESKENDSKIKVVAEEIETLETEKKERQESLYKTEALVKLINSTRENFGKSVEEILNKEYVTEEVKEEEPLVTEFVEVNEYVDDTPEIVIEDTKDEIEEIPEVKEELTNPVDDMVIEDTSELSILDFEKADVPEETLTAQKIVFDDNDKENENYKKVVEETFKKENIDFNEFSSETKENILDNSDRVLKNIIVLKKHMVPLELTVKQSDILYEIDPQDLDDLLDIITTSEEGNGMGFSIDYTYYILNELAHVDIDRLIATYNNEFMNITPKSGVIYLLKMADSTLGNFEFNKSTNMDVLNSLGVKTTSKIAKDYPEFINLDNPLFLNVLNLFDKEDLVSKLNGDIKIIPKILDYWKNN